MAEIPSDEINHQILKVLGISVMSGWQQVDIFLTRAKMPTVKMEGVIQKDEITETLPGLNLAINAEEALKATEEQSNGS